MKNYPGLIRREGGVYYVRMRIPEDLLGILKRRELKQSLKTKDLRTARQEYQRVYGKLLRTITEARERLRPATGKVTEPVPAPELETAVREWFFHAWESYEEGFNGPIPDSPSPDEMVQQAEMELDVLAEPRKLLVLNTRYALRVPCCAARQRIQRIDDRPGHKAGAKPY